MPTYEIELDDGKRYQVEADREPTKDEAMQAIGLQQEPSKPIAPEDEFEPESWWQSLVHPIKRYLPSSLATAGAGIGAATLAAPTAPLTGGVGPIAADIAAGTAAGAAAEKIREEVMGKEAAAEEERQLAANMKAHNFWAGVGTMIGQLPAFLGGGAGLFKGAKAAAKAAGAEYVPKTLAKIPVERMLETGIGGARLGGSEAAAAKVMGDEEVSVPEEIIRGAVTMAPLGLIPHAKSLLAAAGINAPSAALTLETSNAMWDLAHGKEIDPKEFAEKTAESIPAFLALEIAGGLMRRLPLRGVMKAHERIENPPVAGEAPPAEGEAAKPEGPREPSEEYKRWLEHSRKMRTHYRQMDPLKPDFEKWVPIETDADMVEAEKQRDDLMQKFENFKKRKAEERARSVSGLTDLGETEGDIISDSGIQQATTGPAALSAAAIDRALGAEERAAQTPAAAEALRRKLAAREHLPTPHTDLARLRIEFGGATEEQIRLEQELGIMPLPSDQNMVNLVNAHLEIADMARIAQEVYTESAEQGGTPATLKAAEARARRNAVEVMRRFNEERAKEVDDKIKQKQKDEDAAKKAADKVAKETAEAEKLRSGVSPERGAEAPEKPVGTQEPEKPAALPSGGKKIVSATYRPDAKSTDPGTFVESKINHPAAHPDAPEARVDRETPNYGFKVQNEDGSVEYLWGKRGREMAHKIAKEAGQLKPDAPQRRTRLHSDHLTFAEETKPAGEVPVRTETTPAASKSPEGAITPPETPVAPGEPPSKKTVDEPALLTEEPPKPDDYKVKFMDLNENGHFEKEVELPHGEAIERLDAMDKTMNWLKRCLEGK